MTNSLPPVVVEVHIHSNNWLAIVIAVVVAFIAWQQFLLALEKFKLDLFEKRITIFNILRLFLSRMLSQGDCLDSELTKVGIETQTAKFLFNDEMADYIRSLINRGYSLRKINDQILKNAKLDVDLTNLRAEKLEISMGILNELIVLEEKFTPCLKFNVWNHKFWNNKFFKDIWAKMQS